MKQALTVSLLTMNLINVCLHSVGILAMTSLYTKSSHKPQRLYIINLSISELIINLLEVVRNVPNMFDFPPDVTNVVEQVQVRLSPFLSILTQLDYNNLSKSDQTRSSPTDSNQQTQVWLTNISETIYICFIIQPALSYHVCSQGLAQV